MKALEWMDTATEGVGVHFAPDNATAPWAFVSYTELADGVRRAAGLLGDLDVRRGDVVCIVVPDPHDFLLAFYGVLAVGATASPLAPPLTFRSRDVYVLHLAEVLRSARPAVVLTAPELRGVIDAAIDMVATPTIVADFSAAIANDHAAAQRQPPARHVLLQYTSGSSGTPKGVQVSAANLDVNTAAMRTVLDLHAGDVVATWLPHYHDMGLIGSLLTPIRAGVGVRLLKPAQFVRAPRRWLECLGRDGATHTLAPSFGYTYAAKSLGSDGLHGLDFSGWRVALVAAERTDVAGMAGFAALTRPYGFRSSSLMVGYGLAENTLVASSTAPQQRVPVVRLTQAAMHENEPVHIAEHGLLGDDALLQGNWVTSCGSAAAGNRIEIIDDTGAPMPQGRHGEIRITGSSVADGYRGSPHGHTSTSFDGATLRTGDTGFILDDQVYVVGRTGDSIKVRGQKLFAEDLDIKIGAAAGLSPGRHVALLGTVNGANIVAAIVETDSADWAERVRAALASVVGDEVVIALFRAGRKTIERTSSGKPRRRVLWRRLLDGDLRVELVHTDWAAHSALPHPWRVPSTSSPST